MRTAAGDRARKCAGIAPDALALLQRYSWPGNVRELQHAVERAVILSTDPMLRPQVFDIARSPSRQPVPIARDDGALAAAGGAMHVLELPSLDVAEAERVLIQRALIASGQNRTRAAQLLGISVRTLRNKLNVRVETAEAGATEGEGDLA